ncbi:type II toxin-antitoxin system HicA family toxin [Candidatus Wolfebacteria bacterium]|nr:type II toxin-antitoxin system HicA family toxin [Candidatus Wolfebacteria bacterium]
MKRRLLISHLHKHGCLLLREGKKHSVFYNPKTEKTSTVPRHTEVSNMLARKICKDLGAPQLRQW